MRAIALLGLLTLTSCAPTQLGSWWLARQIGARPAEHAVRIERAVALTAADGTKLVADVYLPENLPTTPTILVRIPYSKTVTNTLIATVVGRYWAERGYTVVIQGTRGRYQSEGRNEPFKHER